MDPAQLASRHHPAPGAAILFVRDWGVVRMNVVMPGTDEALPARTDATIVALRRPLFPPIGDSSAPDAGPSDRGQQLVGVGERRLARIRRLLEVPSRSDRELPRPTRATPAAVYCLGPFQLCLGDVAVDGWRSSKARTLFQYLVSHQGQSIPRDTLIEALWPDPSATAPATSLKVAVHTLRQLLTQADVELPLSILSQGSGYQLTAKGLWLDVEEFDRCCTLGRAYENSGQVEEALALYHRAAELYRGDFLEELSDDWPTFRREALKDQYLFVLARLAARAVDLADYHDAIVWCQRLLARDCCREDTYRLLMVCHSHLGQRGRVRSWYELCVRTIRTELDCEPEAETQITYERAMGRRT